MVNLFKGGIKGRLFNNPARGGKGEKKMKKGIVCVAAIVGALVLVGWGCGQRSAAPTDTNSDTNDVSETSSDSTPEVTSEDGATPEDGTPSGWTEYRNERFGFSFQYPEEWDLRVVRNAPFGWNENNYEMEEIQLREVGGDDYIGAYSFAVASNSSHLSTREWLTSNNRVGEALELRDVTVGDTLPGVEIRELTQEIRSPDEKAFPGNLAFSDPGKNYIFFPELGQEREIFADYGTTQGEFEDQILNTMAFGR